jgi:hypothetical protein
MPEELPVEDSSQRREPAQRGEPTDNPLAGGLSISVYVPETIEIKMVDASVLSAYEIWVFIASILASTTVGFWVAYTQALDSKLPTVPYILHTTQVFGGLFIISAITAFTKRRILSRKSKSVKLSVTSARNLSEKA